MQIFICEKHHEVSVLIEIVEGKLDKSLHCLFRREGAEVKSPLPLPDLEIDALQHTLVKVVLIAEVVVNQLLVDARATSDLVNSSAFQSTCREFGARSGQKEIATVSARAPRRAACLAAPLGLVAPVFRGGGGGA